LLGAPIVVNKDGLLLIVGEPVAVKLGVRLLPEVTLGVKLLAKWNVGLLVGRTSVVGTSLRKMLGLVGFILGLVKVVGDRVSLSVGLPVVACDTNVGNLDLLLDELGFSVVVSLLAKFDGGRRKGLESG
jgi:hypothetical protein